MKIILGLLALVSLKETLWAQAVLGGVIVVGLAVIVWIAIQNALYVEPEPILRVEPRFEPLRKPDDPSPERSGLLSRIANLEAELEATRAEIARLQGHNAQLERDLRTARSAAPQDRTNPLFRRVGLDQDAPEWVVVAVRRAYRKRLHPDGHPVHLKVEAERRFKQAESVFDQIWRVKGFRA